jgi:hypothetical protein
MHEFPSETKKKQSPERGKQDLLQDFPPGENLVLRRLYGIAFGYPDGNDAARLNEDPIPKLLGGRDPHDRVAIASQPTLSRFDNPSLRSGNAPAKQGAIGILERMLGRPREFFPKARTLGHLIVAESTGSTCIRTGIPI